MQIKQTCLLKSNMRGSQAHKQLKNYFLSRNMGSHMLLTSMVGWLIIASPALMKSVQV